MAGDVDRAVALACDESGIEEALRPSVRELVDSPEATWPPCCGSSCDPCVLALQCAAKRARDLLTK